MFDTVEAVKSRPLGAEMLDAREVLPKAIKAVFLYAGG